MEAGNFSYKLEVELLELNNGRCPFDEWLAGLKDTQFQRAVDARIARIRDGNFGDHKSVGDGGFELRISKGSGFRVYYGFIKQRLILILCGSNKKTQKQDIVNAKEYWRRYLYENT